jgi:hypothetical protein
MASPLTYGLQEKDLVRLNLRDIPVVVKRPVIRPTDAAADVPTPADIWVIPSAQNSRTSEFLPMADSELMIRQEYHNLLCAILGSLRRQRSAAFQKRDFPPEE